MLITEGRLIVRVLFFVFILSLCFRQYPLIESSLKKWWTSHGWKVEQEMNGIVVFQLSLSETMRKFQECGNASHTILLSLDWNEPNDTITVFRESLNQIALYNKKRNAKWRLWLALLPRGDISVELDDTMKLIADANAISDGTITTLLLDYGLLSITPETISIVQHDIKTCNRKWDPTKLRCGMIIDSLNCLTSPNHITNLGLTPGNIFIVSEDRLSQSPNSGMEKLYGVIPCIDKLKHSGMSLGYKLAVSKHQTYSEELEKINETLSSFMTSIANLMDERSEGELNEAVIKYAVINLYDNDTAALPDIRRYNPVEDQLKWLHRPAEFDKQHFGVSVFLWDSFMFDRNFTLTPVLQQFRAILVEMGAMFGTPARNRVSILARAVRDMKANRNFHSDDSGDGGIPQLHLVMNIYFHEFQKNQHVFHKTLAAVTAGEVILDRVVSSIIFHWGIPLRKGGSLLNPKNESIVSMYIQQAKALQPLLEYINAHNKSTLKFGVVWDTQAIRRISTSKFLLEVQELNKYLDYHIMHLDIIVLKFTISLSALTFHQLRYIARTCIYSLSVFTEKIERKQRTTSAPVQIQAYIGIKGCTGKQQTNVSEIANIILFWEIIQAWAVNQNVTVIMNTAYEKERTDEVELLCSLNHSVDGAKSSCMCGWWNVHTKAEVFNRNETINVTVVEDKKSIARRLFGQGQPQIKRKESRVVHSSGSWDNLLIWLSIGTVLTSVAISALTIYVVHHYRSKYIISKKELRDFLLGTTESSSTQMDNNGVTNAEQRGYNKLKYEITPSSFSIDFDCSLGQGEFASVYKGTINRSGEMTEVAIKMKHNRFSASNQEHGNVLAFRALISEIKILSYLGEHPNIVRLEAAYTAKLRKGSAFVFLEYCQMGSLEKHLRTYRPEEFGATQSSDKTAETSFNAGYNKILTTNQKNEAYPLPPELERNLVQWTQEIVSGMQFLKSKNFVHCDLATRNVLLDASKTAKIADFGLSKRLYNYSEYVTHEKTSLPWRWMAPESLRKMIFNEKTDVWAFGVTLWEIYTLGDLPYPGLSYHVNFPAMLTMPLEIGGIRLARPKYSSDKIYEVMKQCWLTNPNDRPSFLALQTI